MEATFCPENGKSGKSLSSPLLFSLLLWAFKCWKRSADAREVQIPPQSASGDPRPSRRLRQRGRVADGSSDGRTRYENLHNTRNAFFGRFFCASALSPSLALARSSPFPEKYYNGVKRQMEYSVRPTGHVHCQAWSGHMQAW